MGILQSLSNEITPINHQLVILESSFCEVIVLANVGNRYSSNQLLEYELYLGVAVTGVLKKFCLNLLTVRVAKKTHL